MRDSARARRFERARRLRGLIRRLKLPSRIENACFEGGVARKCDTRALWNGAFLLAGEFLRSAVERAILLFSQSLKSQIFGSLSTSTIYLKRLHAFKSCPSQSVRRAYDAHAHHLLLPTSSNVSRSRREAGTTPLVAGASRCSLASGRRERRKPRRAEKKLSKKAFPRACSSSRRP